ncbi:hypothetical protein AXA44_02710 [Rhodococcus sp. SC4]|nr:hypothetical protein AXA44_02710 [Rhodococcus sp. SC4]
MSRRTYPAKRSRIAKDADRTVPLGAVGGVPCAPFVIPDCPVCGDPIEIGQRVAGGRHSVCANEGSR